VIPLLQSRESLKTKWEHPYRDMKRLLQQLGALGLDFVFPPSCGVCGRSGSFLCDSCRRHLHEAEPPRCHRCWGPAARSVCTDCSHSQLEGARSAYVFDDSARALVLALKYRSLHALAGPMGELLADAFARDPLPVDLVVPVPLHGRRRRQRGFNQSELLGRVVSQRARLEMDTRSLRRRRNTPQQSQADDRFRREANMHGAFTCSRAVAGRRVLLIDDVFTTGATLRECAVTLRRAGAISVFALTFCHVD
jgi:ComF family protein